MTISDFSPTHYLHSEDIEVNLCCVTVIYEYEVHLDKITNSMKW